MFTHARQRYRASLGLLAAALLSAGCASLDTTTETIEATEASNSSSFDAESGQGSAATATPATFDRNDPNFQFFNICEELTNEDLAEVGLEFTDADPTIQLDVPSSVCSFQQLGGWEQGYGMQFGLASMNALSQEELLDQVVEIKTMPFERTDLIFFHYPDEDGDLNCEVSGTTRWGRLAVGYGLVREGELRHQTICERALKHFDTFHQLVEENA